MPRETYLAHLQRAFVELVDERATAKGHTRKDFAAKIWPDVKQRTAENRWSAMRTRSFVTDKPQGVLIEDIFSMADALGESPLYLLGIAKDRAVVKAQLEENCLKE